MTEQSKITFQEKQEPGFLERLLLSRHWDFASALLFFCAAISVGLALFHLFTAVYGTPEGRSFRSVHLTVMLTLAIFMKPLFRSSMYDPVWVDGDARNGLRALGLGVDLTLVGLILFVQLWTIWDINAFHMRYGEKTPNDLIVGGILIALVFEATRRVVGWAMVLITGFFMFHALNAQYFFGFFYGPPVRWGKFVDTLFMSSDGIFGIPLFVCATYIVLFIIFGAVLIRSGAGKFFIELAVSLTGHRIGGPAKAAAVASGFMGTVSGSAVANAASTGVLTIPMMNRSGFPPRFSAGVVAAASTGGQLMPPVMGAGAFVMANYTQISYLTIIAVSTLPALLYFLSVAFFVRIEAKRLGLKPDLENTQTMGSVLKQGWPFIIPLAVLVGLLIAGYTPIKAAIYAIISTIATSWLTDTPMTLGRCRDAIVDAVRTMIPTAMLLVAVGLVIMVVNTTGIGAEFSQMIVEWSKGNLIIALVLVALASLILGMGLPVAASYIVLATLSAPMLFDLISQAQLMSALQTGEWPDNVRAIINLFGGDIQVAMQQMPLDQKKIIREQMLDPTLLTGMLLSAHLIIFWLSQDSNVTPPVCLAAFAAASVAKTPPMATGFTSWKIAKGLYLVPVLFAYTPLITGSWPERVESFLWACAGLYALAGLLQWHLERSLSALTAPLVLLSAGFILWPGLPIALKIIGLLLLVAVVVWQKRDRLLKPLSDMS